MSLAIPKHEEAERIGDVNILPYRRQYPIEKQDDVVRLAAYKCGDVTRAIISGVGVRLVRIRKVNPQWTGIGKWRPSYIVQFEKGRSAAYWSRALIRIHGSDIYKSARLARRRLPKHQTETTA